MSLFLDMDAVEIAKGIKEGKWTSSEATETFIAHIEQVNPHINVITDRRYDAARQEAKWADEQVEKGTPLGLLHGVPISIKDNIDVAAMSTTLGLKHRVGQREREDAQIVTILKREGAIILCKTNTPALCFYQESENKATGLSKNPWDLARTVGGSSGGEAALIAVGGAAVGVGSDIGGSIRFPAHYNGVVGYKSGRFTVPDKGVHPIFKYDEQHRMLGIGAMSKSIRDAALINQLITGNKKNYVNLAAYSFIIPEKIEGIPLHHNTETVMSRIFNTMKEEFHIKREVPPYFYDSPYVWQKNMSIEGSKQLKSQLKNGDATNIVYEFIKEKLTGRSEIPAKLSWAMIGATLFKTSAKELEQIRATMKRVDEALETELEHKIIIMPTYHEAAQKHGKQYGELFAIKKSYRWFIPYISYANAWGLPSLTIPAGVDDEGMPIGVQLITKLGQEEALFQFGEWFEDNIYRYRRCSNYDA